MDLEEFLKTIDQMRRGVYSEEDDLAGQVPVGTIVDDTVDFAYAEVAKAEFLSSSGDSPHGRPWHVSFHASSFPGDLENPCPRAALYGLMDAPKSPFDRRGTTVMEAGKDIELNTVRKVRDSGFLPRSNQPGRSSDPEARTPDNKPMPQMGFVDKEHWLTGSVDMPLMPAEWVVDGNDDRPHIVEIKTKHEEVVQEMMNLQRGPDEKHRRQLLCSLGLAHENKGAFLHPTKDIVLDPPEDGSIYYLARDTKHQERVNPLRKEFYFQYDPIFMQKGRAHLKTWRQLFMKGELPETTEYKSSRTHPLGSGWKWSQGECKFCALKKVCRADHADGVRELAKSNLTVIAPFVVPGWNYEKKRARVFAEWDEKDPLLA